VNFFGCCFFASAGGQSVIAAQLAPSGFCASYCHVSSAGDSAIRRWRPIVSRIFGETNSQSLGLAHGRDICFELGSSTIRVEGCAIGICGGQNMTRIK
jgi:hypothetical protein